MAPPRPSAADKRRVFHDMHKSGCFVLPNPWDIGSARYLQSLGFEALATTSAGFAFSQGRPDGDYSLDMALAHCAEMAAATEVPLNVDFEGGYADDPAGVATSVTLCCETGIAGLSIEDSPPGTSIPLYDFDLALARVKAARAAIDNSGHDVVFTARSEGFIRGRPDLDETIRRLKAFADAGADCLYAPGIKAQVQIEAVVEAVAPKPVNFLMATATNFSVEDLAQMGVRRISTGGSLARVAWTAFAASARQIAQEGVFTSFDGTMTNPELNAFFRDDLKSR